MSRYTYKKYDGYLYLKYTKIRKQKQKQNKMSEEKTKQNRRIVFFINKNLSDIQNQLKFMNEFKRNFPGIYVNNQMFDIVIGCEDTITELLPNDIQLPIYTFAYSQVMFYVSDWGTYFTLTGDTFSPFLSAYVKGYLEAEDWSNEKTKQGNEETDTPQDTSQDTNNDAKLEENEAPQLEKNLLTETLIYQVLSYHLNKSDGEKDNIGSKTYNLLDPKLLLSFKTVLEEKNLFDEKIVAEIHHYLRKFPTNEEYQIKDLFITLWKNKTDFTMKKKLNISEEFTAKGSEIIAKFEEILKNLKLDDNSQYKFSYSIEEI